MTIIIILLLCFLFKKVVRLGQRVSNIQWAQDGVVVTTQDK